MDLINSQTQRSEILNQFSTMDQFTLEEATI